MDYRAALADMKDFALRAGDLAVRNQKTVKMDYKDGQFALTETDLAVSRMAQTDLKHWLDQPGHLLIDEESIADAGTPDDAFARSDYQWVLDPIDGTASYALGRTLWGISLGLLHNGVPMAGVIYLPVIGAMLLADNKTAWRIERVGQSDEVTVVLAPKTLPLNSQIFVESYFGPSMNWGDGWYDKIWINRPESAVQGFYNALAGQAAGAVGHSNYSFWDVAAMMAIAQRGGFALTNMETDQPFKRFDANDFHPSWKMRSNWMLCRAVDYAYLKQALTGSNG